MFTVSYLNIFIFELVVKIQMLQKQKSANLIPMRVRVKAVIKDGTIMLLKGPVCCSIGEVVPATGENIYLINPRMIHVRIWGTIFLDRT